MAHEHIRPTTWTHECRMCRSELIQPSDWDRRESRWQIVVRCPECGESYEALLDQDQVTELSYAMEAGFHALLEDLDEIDRELFEDQCDRLISALRSDGILPMDF